MGRLLILVFFIVNLLNVVAGFDEKTYMDLVALCQTLPGPASSQVAIAIGMKEHGLLGGIAAISGFLLPSVVLLILAAYGIQFLNNETSNVYLHGLKLAVVAQAILNMMKHFCTNIPRIIITFIATIIAFFETSFIGQVGAIVVGAIGGNFFLKTPSQQKEDVIQFSKKMMSLRAVALAWALFLFFLLGLPAINTVLKNHTLELFDSFYQTGALVFGGGHVVLPLLQAKLVVTGCIDNNTFLAGYGLTEAIPGPLFSFAAFLGTVIQGPPNGWIMGLMCVFAIYLPSFLILLGVLPVWEKWRHHSTLQTIIAGISAAVVGLLLAAFYHPIWTDSIQSYWDIGIALFAFILLVYWRWPQWLIVPLCILLSLVI